MKSLYKNILPTILMIAAANSNRNQRQTYHLPLEEKPLTEKEKLYRHHAFSGDQQQHTYVICGKTIKAPNKKVTRKIYARLYDSK